MKSKTCRVCNEGTLRESSIVQKYYPNKKAVEVELLESHCEKCKAVSISSAQHSENLRRLAARKAEYGDQLMGEEYVALRKRYGLTQRQASKIFGKGLIAFSRYENEETYPDASTRLLIELAIAQPDILKTLADKAGVEIPLWKERIEDAEKAGANTVEPKDSEAKTRYSDANERVEDVWFLRPGACSNPYGYIYGSIKQNSVIRKRSSVGCVAPSIDIGWFDCSKELDLLNSVWESHVEHQSYVFKDEAFSPLDETGPGGEVTVGEAAMGGAA